MLLSATSAVLMAAIAPFYFSSPNTPAEPEKNTRWCMGMIDSSDAFHFLKEGDCITTSLTPDGNLELILDTSKNSIWGGILEYDASFSSKSIQHYRREVIRPGTHCGHQIHIKLKQERPLNYKWTSTQYIEISVTHNNTTSTECRAHIEQSHTISRSLHKGVAHGHNDQAKTSRRTQ